MRLTPSRVVSVAVVATARKLVTIAWHMLTNNEPYRYAVSSTVEAKLARLRFRVTGQRRKGGISKGAPRPAQIGKRRTKAVAALDAVYEKEQLPPLTLPAPGELKMPAENRLTAWTASLHKPGRKPKTPPPGPAIP